MSPRHDNMGVLNKGWGICGFTSSLYALYEHNPSQRAGLSVGASTGSRVLAEIKAYLRMLQAAGRNDLLGEIETFTKSFGGNYSGFTIDSYISNINNIVNTVVDTSSYKHSIALPPHAVVDYLQRICQFKAAKVVGLNYDAPEMILGVCKTNMTMYGGLAHYLYLRDGTIYSWGKRFKGRDLNESVTLAGKSVGSTYTIGHKIAIGSRGFLGVHRSV